MTFSPLELVLATGFVSTIVGVTVKIVSDRQCVRKVDCDKHRKECSGDLNESVEWLIVMMQMLCEKEGISVETQMKMRGKKE